MNKIRKNITSVETKFHSLKAAFQLHNQPIPISQVAEIITSGAIPAKHADEFLKYIHSSPEIQTKEFINQKWYELELSQMVGFLDKVAFFHNKNERGKSPLKINLSPSPQKRKIKAPMSEAHQNPFIPAKIMPSIKNQSPVKQNSGQKNPLQNKIKTKNGVKQNQQQGYYSSLLLLKSKSLKQSEMNPSENISKVKQIMLDLPEDFQNLSPQERYAILSKKYGKDKNILQKKFDLIYKHYRKEMFIPFESFQINNELLMDLRIFLKYYREFQIVNRFKTNDAINHFKKLALNGLWLDDKKFVEIHYKLIQLLQDEQSLGQNQTEIQKNENNLSKIDEIKQKTTHKIKQLVEKIIKIKQLSDVVSENKIKQIFNNKEKPNTLKRIVEAHSGLTKDDVMLKLQERVQYRKYKKNVLLGNLNRQMSTQSSPQKRNNQIQRNLQDITQRLSPKKQSIYDELQMPKLRSRQLKKSSVYLSLQQMDIQKEKEKLKMLVNERENEQYLDAFFKKQKQIFNLPRTKSVTLSKHPTENEESTNGFTHNSVKTSKNPSKESIFVRNFSLPRMKFN